MKHLFSSFQIRDLKLKNRIVMPALASFLIENDGSITDKTVEHYRNRASGGVAMVIVEAHASSPEGVVSNHQARLHEDRHIEGLSRIVDVIREEGAIPAVQIHHAGRQTSIKVINQKPYAPSNLPCPTIRGEVKPLNLEGIQKIIKDFGDSASRAIQAGVELIEIHGAHGYLLNQFLSRFSNIREDEYGGSLVNRARFVSEIIKEVRSRIGKDFPLSFKISAQEFVPDGLTVEESIDILKLLVPAGLDIIQVSAGNDASPEWIAQPMFMKKACLADSAGKIREALDIPIMTVGRINDPIVADTIIKEGKTDLVCIGRGLLADNELPKKAKEGRLDDIRTCIACNTCMESIFRKGRIECLVNPGLGREKELEIQPTDSPKKIMVIGGGPGGLNVAWIAAKRGHNVTLYEKESELGGQLILGSVDSYKKELLNLTNFLKTQVNKYKVTYHLDFEVTPETINEEKPDEIILATGSEPVIPPVPGVNKSMVFTIPEIMNGHKPLRNKTVVVGGGAIGCEVAHYLSENNCRVTIIEQLPKIANQLESITRKVLLSKLMENEVEIMTGQRLSRIDENGVFVCDTDGNERFIDAENVVIAIGSKPDNRLYEKIKSMNIPIHRIGDCLETRSAKAAIYEGAVIGTSL